MWLSSPGITFLVMEILPTLYTHFETDKFSCLVMEFCPGGDLHTLRQRQPGKYFSEQAAKYVLLLTISSISCVICWLAFFLIRSAYLQVNMFALQFCSIIILCGMIFLYPHGQVHG